MWRTEPDWNRSYRRLLAYLAAGGTLDGPANRTDGKLSPQQTALLDALHT